MALVKLGTVALQLLAKQRKRRGKPMAPAAMAPLLAARGVAKHRPALAFERDYGGLALATDWLVGAGACLSSDVSVTAPGKHELVPVILTDNDNVYYLDATGAAWGEDMIEDPAPVRFAKNARAMLTRILVREHAFASPDTQNATVPGTHGRALASTWKLKKVADASDDVETWWTNGTVFVVERAGETHVARATRAQLKVVHSLVPPVVKPAGPVTFDSVMRERSTTVIVRPGLPGKFAAVYRAFLAAHLPGATVGARFTIATMPAEVTALYETADENDAFRIALTFAQGARAEIFFRHVVATDTFMNVFQFGKKPSEAAWEAVVDPWISTLS